jgi:hypothetical protein
LDKDWERLGKLPPEEKAKIMMDMSDACIRICADGIRTRYPKITEKELVEKVHERLDWAKRDRIRVKKDGTVL